MTENIKIPALRFKGFTEAWEQRKVEDIANRYDNLRVPITAINRVSGTTPYYGANGIQDYVKGYTHKGEFVLVAEDGANDLKNYPVQYVNGEIWANNHTHVLQAKENKANNKYIKYLISQTNIEPLLVGGGRAKLNAEVMMKMDVKISPDIDEQTVVGTLFSNLDNLITLHQRKYDRLVNIKKGFLEKMFPQNGSNTPEIRFKGFTEAWEQRELWKLTIWDKKFNEVDNEKQPKVIKYPYVLADVFNDIEDSSGNVLLLSTGNFVGYTSEEKAGANLCNGEIIAIPWGGSANVKYFKGKFVTADNRIATSNNINILKNKYLYYWLLNNIRTLENIYRGASIKHPSMNDVLNIVIKIPKADEQLKIIDILTNLDNLITLHQRKLEKLKNIKNGCLEKMFV